MTYCTMNALSPAHLSALCLSALLLIGCERSGEPPLPWARAYERALSELSSSQASAPHMTRRSPLVRLPLLRERALKRAPSPSISARALIGLSGCEVSALIAELNSPRGAGLKITAAQVSALKRELIEVGVAEVAALKAGLREVGAGEVSAQRAPADATTAPATIKSQGLERS